MHKRRSQGKMIGACYTQLTWCCCGWRWPLRVYKMEHEAEEYTAARRSRRLSCPRSYEQGGCFCERTHGGATETTDEKAAACVCVVEMACVRSNGAACA